MPVLPLIDLLIIVGWTGLMAAFLLKAIYVSTAYRPTLLGLGPLDLVGLAGICLVFALTLAARTWVKYHEPQLMARRRRLRQDAGGQMAKFRPEGGGLEAVGEAEPPVAEHRSTG